MWFFVIVAVAIGYIWYKSDKEEKEIRAQQAYEDMIDHEMHVLARKDTNDKIDFKRRYMASSIWKYKRERRLRHDGYACVLCGSINNLDVHHIVYDNIGHESIHVLRTLCRECHDMVHEKFGYPSRDPHDYLKGYFWDPQWDKKKENN